MEGTFAINILQGSDVDSRLEKYGITPLAYRGTVNIIDVSP